MVKRDGIEVPPVLPKILKNYAKDMIRTQPFDILCWSAAYFRCIANNMQPPTKKRFEGMVEDGHLTNGFLKTLVKQIGKGYYVERDLLQKRWKGLGLAEQDLFVLFAASGMLDWDTVHWLKLVAVMAASISENFDSSILLMCETLTEDADGGPCSVPFWMFNVGYTFLAGLDRSVAHSGNHPLTDEKQLSPVQLSSNNFRESLVAEWKQFMTTHSNSNISSNLKFGNAYDGFKQSTEFENLIILLKDTEMFRNATNCDDNENANNIDQSIIMHELGAPWSWMYDFIEHNSPTIKSYSFIEIVDDEEQSVPNVTPIETKVDKSVDVMSDLSRAKSLIERDANEFDVDVPIMPGIGQPIQQEVVNDFLNYLRYRAIDENGMIFPRHFKETLCPKMA